jgi:N-acetylglutamate synthase-like GNAT family acetyltransferase
MIELIQIHDARLIPKVLIDQVESIETGAFYRHMKNVWNFKNDFIFVIVDEAHQINGYVWFQINELDNSVFINTISLCEEWKNTDKILEIGELIKEEMANMCVTKAFFLTDKPAFYKKMGMHPTKEILLMGEFDGSN